QQKDGAVYKLRGNVRIEYTSNIFSGGNDIHDSDSGDATADVNRVLQGGPNSEHIEAARGTYILQNETGRFGHIHGSIGLPTRGRHILPSTSNAFFFTGRVVEKTATDQYRVTDGTVTTCEMPHPKWKFFARKVVVDVGGNATI